MSTPQIDELGRDISLAEMLDARENRVRRQQELQQTYPMTMISFTMNIAGPIKNSALIRRGFEHGRTLLRQALLAARLEPVHMEVMRAATGDEAYYMMHADPLTVKRITASIEDSTPMARLYDMDVLRADGRKVDRAELGLTARKCLICGGPAKACARSRTHTVTELQTRTTVLLSEGLNEIDAETIARQSIRAILYEITTTPKPGLVDRRNTGSHRDMDSYTFMSSAAALYPYFKSCAETGLRSAATGASAVETFAALRPLGLMAEGSMLDTTNGVNTHKGAIFSVGLAAAALGRISAADRKNPAAVLAECAAMTAGLTCHDYAAIEQNENAVREDYTTVGQWLYAAYGLTGVRGQAEAGFPAVLHYGLPTLEQGLYHGCSLDQAGAAAMLAMLAVDDDTNMISRGGRELQQRKAREIASLLSINPYPSIRTMEALDDDFIADHLSPGGSADLLAICYLLYFFKSES